VLKAVPDHRKIELPSRRLVELRSQLGVKSERLWEVAAFIAAYGVTNVAVVGEGVIDGNGRDAYGLDGTPLRWRDLYFYRCRDIRIEA